MADAEDRTHVASARRLQRAREEGRVAVSPELSGLLLLAGLCVLLLMRAPAEIQTLCNALRATLALAGTVDGQAGVTRAVAGAGAAAFRALAWLFGTAVLLGVAATLVQTGMLFNPAALLPDLARLSPMRGLSRLLSAAKLIEAGRSLLKLSVLGASAWRLLSGRLPALRRSMLQQPAALPATLGSLVFSILATMLAVQACVAVMDVAMVRARHGKSMRMSRAEVQEEARDTEGDPHLKARLRRLRRDRARRRMADAVAKATMVVTNPTHYAVALHYDRGGSAAPRVVAKGVDEMAARIRAVAEEQRVPLVANPPLARALYKVELDSDIPPEHYQAVAELIAYVWRLQGKARALRQRDAGA